ncbi:MAG: uroporphyrinogen decarboxylase family protein [Planctomycetota bacterium]
MTTEYLLAKIDAGVDAVQLFESSAAALDAAAYGQWALPYQQIIFDRLRDSGVPTVLFAKGTARELLAESRAAVISIGSDQSIVGARRAMPTGGVQGNLDNHLLRDGTPGDVRRTAERCIADGGHRGHMLNLGHGVIKDTPVEIVQAVIDAAHGYFVEPEVLA